MFIHMFISNLGALVFGFQGCELGSIDFSFGQLPFGHLPTTFEQQRSPFNNNTTRTGVNGNRI